MSRLKHLALDLHVDFDRQQLAGVAILTIEKTPLARAGARHERLTVDKSPSRFGKSAFFRAASLSHTSAGPHHRHRARH